MSKYRRLVERSLIGSGFPGLVETERAHKDALIELEGMRQTMERMEQERAEMVAEVEAQIERALASMAVDVDESDYGGELSSRPGSRMSTSARSASETRSRRASDAMKSGSHENSGSRLRSIGTESTLAEAYERGPDDTLVVSKSERETDTIAEEEETPASPVKKKRFSATQTEVVQDGMTAVDEGISERSDKIAQKVLQIQQKVSSYIAADLSFADLLGSWKRHWRRKTSKTGRRDLQGTRASAPTTPPMSVPTRVRMPLCLSDHANHEVQSLSTTHLSRRSAENVVTPHPQTGLAAVLSLTTPLTRHDILLLRAAFHLHHGRISPWSNQRRTVLRSRHPPRKHLRR